MTNEQRLERIERIGKLFVRAGLRERRSRRELDEKIDIIINSQIANEERFARTDAQIVVLSESQQHTDAKIVVLTESQQHTDAKISALTESQQHTDAQIVVLTESQQHTDTQIAALTESQKQTDRRLDTLIDIVIKGTNGNSN